MNYACVGQADLLTTSCFQKYHGQCHKDSGLGQGGSCCQRLKALAVDPAYDGPWG